MRNLGLLLICLLLTACATGSVTKAPPAEVVALSVQELRNELAKIPGARVADGEPLVARFPAGTLFAVGSALPMPDGTAALDALSALLKRSELNWQLRVRAASGEGEQYDEQLAGTRAEILKIYFKNSGIDLRKLKLSAVAETGAALELQPIH